MTVTNTAGVRQRNLGRIDCNRRLGFEFGTTSIEFSLLAQCVSKCHA